MEICNLKTYNNYQNICSALLKGEHDMSAIDHCIKTLIIEQLQKTDNTDLLDLIYKLLLTEC